MQAHEQVTIVESESNYFNEEWAQNFQRLPQYEQDAFMDIYYRCIEDIGSATQDPLVDQESTEEEIVE